MDDPDQAYRFKEAAFTVSITEVGVEMPDEPGGLARVLAVWKGRDQYWYLYAFIGRGQGGALVIFRVENLEEAVQHLQAAGVKVVQGEILYKM